MTVYFAEAIYWRRLTETDLKAKFGHWGNPDGSGAHSRIYLPGDPEEVAEFFNYDEWDGGPDGTIRVRVEPVEEYEGTDAEIEIDYNNGRNEWQLPSNSTDYPLWEAENGFIPTVDDLFDEERENLIADHHPLLYFVRDIQGRFHTRMVFDNSPERLGPFNVAFEEPVGNSASGIIEFTSEDEA